MPELSGSQFRDFSIERSVASKNEQDPYSRARGYQNYTSNLYSPSFSGDYNSMAERNPSTASAYEGEDEE